MATQNNGEFEKLPTEEPKEDVKDDLEEDTVCGFGRFRPAWLQRLANPKAFMALYCLLGIFEGASFTYMVGVLSTWEKRYAYDSKVSGVIMLADNLSSIVISILVGYYGRHAHRPRWIAGGMLIVAFASFLSATPYFIYGPGLHLLNRNLEANRSDYQLCQTDPPDEVCAAEGSKTTVAVTIFFLANLLNGFGYTAFYTVGTVYLDDSIKKKNSPLYFSAQMALRLLGPSFGYILASFSLQFYEDPRFDPGLTRTDPRWVGAWWIGFLVLSLLLFVFSLPMLLFPKRLPSMAGQQPEVKKAEVNKQASPPQADNQLKLKDLPSAFLRLLKNPLWVFHTLAIIFHVNGYMGYFILMPRYMEAHFRQSASGASFFSGSTSLVTMIVGILLGGVVISRFRPRPRVLTGYMTAVTLVSGLAMAASMLFACPTLNVVGQPHPGLKTLDLVNECNAGCGCNNQVFHPVCSGDGQATYFSPCYAGCSSDWTAPGNKTMLLDCRCDEASTSQSFVDLIAESCPFGCNLFLPYIVIMSLSKMVGATARVGSMLLSLRCVDPKDKNLALGGFSAVLSAFAFIPYPLAFGALADSTCLVWEEKCGKKGNCWIYDVDKLRLRMHGASFGLILVATVFEVFVWYYSKRLTGDFYDSPPAAADGGEDRLPLKELPLAEKRRESLVTGGFGGGLGQFAATSLESIGAS